MPARPLTFATLDAARGWPPTTGDSPLERWYGKVATTPLEQLTDLDVARAVRQQVHPEYVMPIALDRLTRNFVAGELYDGELATSLARAPEEVWRRQPGLVERAVAMARAHPLDQLDAEYRDEVAGWMRIRDEVAGWMRIAQRLSAGIPRLAVTAPKQRPRTVELSVIDDTIIGAAEDATIALSADAGAGPGEVRLRPDDEGFTAHAQEARMKVNDHKTVEARLRSGDLLSVGKASFRFTVKR